MVIFQDDFSDNKNNWPVLDGPLKGRWLEDEKCYLLENTTDELYRKRFDFPELAEAGSSYQIKVTLEQSDGQPKKGVRAALLRGQEHP